MDAVNRGMSATTTTAADLTARIAQLEKEADLLDSATRRPIVRSWLKREEAEELRRLLSGFSPALAASYGHEQGIPR